MKFAIISSMDTVVTHDVDRNLWKKKLLSYARFLKLEHTLFSLPLLFSGALLAGPVWPGWRVTLLILLAGTGARTLALCLNRLIDRNIDGKNPRTRSRELVTGALSVWDVVLASSAGLVIYLWATREINTFCLAWSWVPVLLFLIYPTLKRFTWFSHFGLGITWAMAPLAGWFAIKPGFTEVGPALILAIFSFFWLSGFDIIYATLDEAFDRSEGLFSLPAQFGRNRALRISSLLHGAAFLCLALLYATSLNGVTAAFFLILIGFLLFLEHMLAVNVNLSFFKINVLIGFLIFAMILTGIQKEFQ